MPSKKPANKSLLLDSSVVIKWYIDENNTTDAVALRDAFLSHQVELFFPELGLYEIANALRYSGLFTEADIHEYLQSTIDLGIHILPFDLSALKAAITLSLAKNIAVYDSYFAVIADAIGAVYITADEKACNKLEGLTYVKSLANRGDL